MSIQAVFQGKSVFISLPTGYGKSMCYQALPFVMDYQRGLVGCSETSAVLVVSPLTALMVDQVKSLRSRGVHTSIITSGGELVKGFMATESSLSRDSLLFCAPEALVLSKWRDALEKIAKRIVVVAVDEAHCASKW